jgi:hypothetical protein
MKTKRLLFLFLAIIFSGCAITGPVKKINTGSAAVFCSAGATPCSMNYLLEKDARKFIDSNYGNIYAPMRTSNWEFNGELSYLREQVDHRIAQYGLALYYRLNDINWKFGNDKNYAVTAEATSDERHYYASLEPRVTIEPNVGSYFLFGDFYLKINAGLPLTFFSWEKYYLQRLPENYDQWGANQVEKAKNIFWPGLSARISLGHKSDFSISGSDHLPGGLFSAIRYSPVKVGGKRLNNLTWSFGAEIDGVSDLFSF